jgi:hypothetical protein
VAASTSACRCFCRVSILALPRTWREGEAVAMNGVWSLAGLSNISYGRHTALSGTLLPAEPGPSERLGHWDLVALCRWGLGFLGGARVIEKRKNGMEA